MLKPGTKVRFIKHDNWSEQQGWKIGDITTIISDIIVGANPLSNCQWVEKRPGDTVYCCYSNDCFEEIVELRKTPLRKILHLRQ